MVISPDSACVCAKTTHCPRPRVRMANSGVEGGQVRHPAPESAETAWPSAAAGEPAVDEALRKVVRV
jgi:hypothetical protein